MSADHAFFNQQLEDGFGANLRGNAFEHLSTATTGFGGSRFHPVGTAFGFDHFQAFGPWFGRLQGGDSQELVVYDLDVVSLQHPAPRRAIGTLPRLRRSVIHSREKRQFHLQAPPLTTRQGLQHQRRTVVDQIGRASCRERVF